MLVEKDIQYRSTEGWDPGFNCLDIFYEKPGIGSRNRPVVVLIHGGGWVEGDKSYFSDSGNRNLMECFVGMGYVVAVPNFRLALHPELVGASISEMTSDIAKTLKWLSVNARKYGGQSTGFVLLGFSSGAHLASLLVSDSSYLKGFRLDRQAIRGVIGMDVPQYDVPYSLELLRTQSVGIRNQDRRIKFLRRLFGKTSKQQKQYSPAHYLEPDINPVSFLLVSAGVLDSEAQTFSYMMSKRFREQLVAQGVDARHSHFEQYSHNDLISQYSNSKVPEVVESWLRHLGLPAEAGSAKAPHAIQEA